MKIRFLPDCDCRCLNALTDIEVCEQDVIDIIFTLNVDKAVGHDIISNHCPCYSIDRYKNCFSRSVESCTCHCFV